MSAVIDFAARQVDRLSEAYRADGLWLSIVRILFAAHVLLFSNDLLWIGRVPAEFFHARPGMFAFLSGPPDTWVLIALTIARYAFAGLILVGFLTVPASAALTIVMMIASGLTYSFGKIDHEVLYEIFPVFMALAGWGSRLSIDARLTKRTTDRALPMFLWALTVAFALFSAALPKAVGGWLNPNRHATLGYIAQDLADGQRVGVLAPLLASIDVSWFWKAFDYATLFVEGWLIVAVFFPILFRCGVALLICFHIGVALTLGIDFSAYVLVYLPFFSPVFVWIVGRLKNGGRAAAEPVTGTARGAT